VRNFVRSGHGLRSLSPGSLAGAAQEAVRTQRRVGIVLQTDPQSMTRGPTSCIASAPRRHCAFRDGAGRHASPDLPGEERFTILDYVSREPFLVARIQPHAAAASEDNGIEGRGMSLRDKALEAVQLMLRRLGVGQRDQGH